MDTSLNCENVRSKSDLETEERDKAEMRDKGTAKLHSVKMLHQCNTTLD